MAKAPKTVLPDAIWVMALHTFNAVGGITHVSTGDKFWTSKEKCQNDIDTMESWLGMGDRSRYHPLKLVNGEL